MSQPRLFGNFELIENQGEVEMLGAGSFGKTYRGKHRFLDTEVAVKVIRRQFSDNEKYKETFLKEARLVAQLSDPHIVRILDFGEQENRLYYVMEYCDRGTLKDLTKSPQPITDAIVIEIARQATQALVAAHRQNIIHRDFKPENIMLSSGDNSSSLLVKLIDFGLAQSVADISGFAEARAEGFHGTPMFASPEQLREEPLDGRSDLFSLGMTLWWVSLGGHLPFGSEKETVTERLSPKTYQTLLQETLSSDIAALLSGLVAKDTRDRHASAEDFLSLVNDTFPPQIIPAQGKKNDDSPLGPIHPKTHEGALEDHYQIVRKISNCGPGAYYEAIRKSQPIDNDEKFWLWIFEPKEAGGRAEWRDLFEQRMAVLQHHQPAGISIPADYEEFDRGTLAYRLQWHSGKFVSEGHDGRHQFKLLDLMEGLERITRSADEAVSLDLPLPEFTPDTIEWTPGSPDFAPLLPTLIEDLSVNGSDDGTGTLNPDAMDNISPAARFVMLIYPLLAGRRFPMAALFSPSGYVTIPNISESSNRYLMEWASSEDQSHSLSSLLATLLASEGLKEHTMLSLGSRMNTMGTARTTFPSAAKTQARIPKSTPSTPPGTIAATTASILPTPVLQDSPSAQTPPHSPPTVVSPPISPTTEAQSSSSGKKTAKTAILALATLALVFGAAVAGGAIWFFYLRENPAKADGTAVGTNQSEVKNIAQDAEKLARQNELKQLFFQKDRVSELESGLRSYVSRYGSNDEFAIEAQSFLERAKNQSTKPIRVPEDFETLSAAMQKAVEGQTIELSAGSHNAQVICKPGVRIKGKSSGSTSLIMPDASTSLLSIRGGKTVYLANLTLRASLKQSDSPALVSIVGGSLDITDCVFKETGSEGIRISANGKLNISSSEVKECDGHGIQILGGSSARLLDCEIKSNGKSGIHIAPSGVILTATNCEFSENSFCGIEAEGGATIQLSGGSLDSNLEAGINFAGQGTHLKADGVAFSSNVKFGVYCIQGASLELSACNIENNRFKGLQLRNADTSSIIRNTTIKDNGEYGLHIQGKGSGDEKRAISIESCKFLNHAADGFVASEGGIAALEGETEFVNNIIGIAAISNSRVSLTGGLMRYRPEASQVAVLEESNGKVEQTGVVIDEVE